MCDEPVSALDVSIQSQVLNLLKDIQERRKASYLFISHDLSVVNFIADRVCVMFLGKVCEIIIFTEHGRVITPVSEKKRRFIENAGKKREILKGEIPSPIDIPTGCRFHTRCPYCSEICITKEPGLREVCRRYVACHIVK